MVFNACFHSGCRTWVGKQRLQGGRAQLGQEDELMLEDGSGRVLCKWINLIIFSLAHSCHVHILDRFKVVFPPTRPIHRRVRNE